MTTKLTGMKLYVDGSEVKPAVAQFMTSMEVSESLEQMDLIEARFTIPPTGSPRDAVLKLAKHGAKVKVELCEDGSAKRTLEGLLVEIGYGGSEASGMEMTLRGLSDLTKLKNSSMSIVHEGNDAAVVKKIAGGAGLGADIQGVDGSAEFQFQPNLTNAEVVQQIAKRNNYVFRVDQGKLVFSRVTKAGAGAKVKVPWLSVSSFSVNQSLDGLVTDVTVTGKDLKANKWLKGQAKAGDIAKISGGKSGTDLAKKTFGKVEYLIDHTDDADQSQLVAVAKGELQRRAERFVQGEFTCKFQPAARSGAQVEITDPLHWSAKGPFIIREVSHLWDVADGYRSRISFISDSLPSES